LLTKLSIKNFALIEQLSVNFNDGFSIITGETGAGKSILVGALGLVLGKRADTTYLKNNSEKCIIEGEFNIENYNLKSFFEDEDLDYESNTIIRREILPSGKSRAFINDTPTTLSVLNSLSLKLIDIHSQHQTLELSNNKYQFEIIDTMAANTELIVAYKNKLSIYNRLQKELGELLNSQESFKQQYEYNLHLFEELETASLVEGEQEEVERELELMNNVELIKNNLLESIGIADNEEFGIINSISLFKSKIAQISNFSNNYEEFFNRIQSLEIELKDIVQELENSNENVNYSKEAIDKLSDRLQLIYDLLKKHTVISISELIEVKESLSEKVQLVQNSSEIISNKESEASEIESELEKIASNIHNKRANIIPKFVKQLEGILSNLGMENSRFKFELSNSDSFLSNGKNELRLLYSANKGDNYGELKKIASGGELSRIMLSIKSILSKHTQLPTIIFDEIDTGVSGEVSNKMADIMKNMSSYMQVMSITHLPQVAAKGEYHYKVFKEDVSGKTVTQLKLLSNQERIEEIAEILGGKTLSESALAHAKELLN
jgi:DNA repair protein RecN (Recombination protein N)